MRDSRNYVYLCSSHCVECQAVVSCYYDHTPYYYSCDIYKTQLSRNTQVRVGG